MLENILARFRKEPVWEVLGTVEDLTKLGLVESTGKCIIFEDEVYIPMQKKIQMREVKPNWKIVLHLKEDFLLVVDESEYTRKKRIEIIFEKKK